MKKVYFILILGIFYLVACQPKQVKKDLKWYFKQEFKMELPASVHTIIILDDIGCKGCNLSLSNWIQKKALDHDKIWVVVTATGAHMDISPYLNVRYKNVFIEQNIGKFKELQLCGLSGFMFVKEGKVEKTYCISAQELENHLQLLNARLKL